MIVHTSCLHKRLALFFLIFSCLFFSFGCAGHGDIPKNSHAYSVRMEANAYRTQYNRLKAEERMRRSRGDIIGADQVKAMKDEAYKKYKEKLAQFENAAARHRKKAGSGGTQGGTQ